MSTTTKPAGERPAGFPSTAIWPPRVWTGGPVTTTSDVVLRRSAVPEGGFGVQLGTRAGAPAPAVARVDRAVAVTEAVIAPAAPRAKKGRR